MIGALAGRVFVAHNVRFDWGFVAVPELQRTRGFMLAGPRLCTARLARRLVPVAESCGLDWLTQYFDLEESRATPRQEGTRGRPPSSPLLKLLDLARAEGARTFADLEALQQRKRQGEAPGRNPRCQARFRARREPCETSSPRDLETLKSLRTLATELDAQCGRSRGEISALHRSPEKPVAVLVLAHGAGAGVRASLSRSAVGRIRGARRGHAPLHVPIYGKRPGPPGVRPRCSTQRCAPR